MGNCQALPLVADGQTSVANKAGLQADPKNKTSAGVIFNKEEPSDDRDPFKIESAAAAVKQMMPTTQVLRESHIAGMNQAHAKLEDRTQRTCTTVTCTSESGYSGSVSSEFHMDYKSLYEASLRRIEDLEEQTHELSRDRVEIKAAKELYLNIFEHFPALIWRSRLDKQCDYFNQTWLNWTGRTMEQEFGNGWAESVHPDDFDACLKTYVEAFDKREPFYMEYRLLDKNGEYKWIGDHGTPFNDLDGTTFLGYIGSCYDITEQRNNERKLQKLNATKDKLFSIVAHDLRNPISTFVSLSEYLMDGYEDFSKEEMTEIAQQMHKDSKNTLGLLEHLLEWSKAQSEDIAFDPQPIPVDDLFQEAVSQVDINARAKKIDIQTQIILPQADGTSSDESPPPSVTADKHMLITVLRNLLVNAIKFTPQDGTILLKAQWDDTTTGSDAQPSVLLTVADSGVGMSQEQIDGLFQLSLRPSDSREGTDHEKGSGLGLVICKDFIETRHKGQIWAESPQDVGTELKIRLPQQ